MSNLVGSCSVGCGSHSFGRVVKKVKNTVNKDYYNMLRSLKTTSRPKKTNKQKLSREYNEFLKTLKTTKRQRPKSSRRSSRRRSIRNKN